MHQVIEDIAELEALRPEWSDLWQRCPRATPFQSSEWLLGWWHHIFQGGRLWSIAIREQGRLVGLLPFYRWGDRLQNLSFIGTGITDYNDVLLDDGVALPPIQGDWENANFEELREGSPLLDLRVPERCSVCPVISLPANNLDPKLAVDLHRSSNRLYRAGSVLIERTDDPADLFTLHRARWQERGEAGMLAEDKLQAFHTEVIAGFGRLGILRLYRMRLDGRPAAVIYAFTHRRRCYAYLSGFDPELSKLSPGTVLLQHVIAEATREGALAFDFLREPEPYKYRWGARDEPTWRVRLLSLEWARSNPHA